MRGSSPEAPQPASLGPWRLTGVVARTDLFTIYRARPAEQAASAGDLYAVKVLNERWQESTAAAAMLRSEAAVGRQVTHPNLAPVLSYRLDEWPPFVVTPYYSGGTLQERLARGWRPGVEGALWIARQTAQALDALFRPHGWMHSDLKPANLHVAAGGHVTVLDMGLARPAGRGASLAERPIAGTLHYMAPEAITSPLAADIRSDLFSLGVILYELLAGRLPHDGDDPAQLAALKRDQAAPPLHSFAPRVPPDVARLVHACLAKEPLRRPQTPAELVERLVRLEIEYFARSL